MLIGAMLHNEKLDRFHPLFFRPAPMPGGKDADMMAQRYRSHGHHTDGFATLEEAEEYMRKACEENGWRDFQGHLRMGRRGHSCDHGMVLQSRTRRQEGRGISADDLTPARQEGERQSRNSTPPGEGCGISSRISPCR